MFQLDQATIILILTCALVLVVVYTFLMNYKLSNAIIKSKLVGVDSDARMQANVIAGIKAFEEMDNAKNKARGGK